MKFILFVCLAGTFVKATNVTKLKASLLARELVRKETIRSRSGLELMAGKGSPLSIDLDDGLNVEVWTPMGSASTSINGDGFSAKGNVAGHGGNMNVDNDGISGSGRVGPAQANFDVNGNGANFNTQVVTPVGILTTSVSCDWADGPAGCSPDLDFDPDMECPMWWLEAVLDTAKGSFSIYNSPVEFSKDVIKVLKASTKAVGKLLKQSSEVDQCVAESGMFDQTAFFSGTPDVVECLDKHADQGPGCESTITKVLGPVCKDILSSDMAAIAKQAMGKVRGFYHACMEKVLPGMLDDFEALTIGMVGEWQKDGKVQGFELGVAFEFEDNGDVKRSKCYLAGHAGTENEILGAALSVQVAAWRDRDKTDDSPAWNSIPGHSATIAAEVDLCKIYGLPCEAKISSGLVTTYEDREDRSSYAEDLKRCLDAALGANPFTRWLGFATPFTPDILAITECPSAIKDFLDRYSGILLPSIEIGSPSLLSPPVDVALTYEYTSRLMPLDSSVCGLFENCDGCLALNGFSDCSAACAAGGNGNKGTCAAPNSTDANKCCACEWDDCKGCLGEFEDCSAACHSGGNGNKGTCAVPDSTNPNKCCACETSSAPDDCYGCLGGYKDCNEACQKSGNGVRGHCAAPGSTDPDVCCACEWDDCEGCLGSNANCNEACYKGGNGNKGVCAAPKSTDPNACCSCSWDHCGGCLNGHQSCEDACNSGGDGNRGMCMHPFSTNPNQCCICWNAPDSAQDCLTRAVGQYGNFVYHKRGIQSGSWSNAPYGCSVQARGDYAVHWNSNKDGKGTEGSYAVVAGIGEEVGETTCLFSAVAQFGDKVVAKRGLQKTSHPDIPYGCSVQAIGDWAAHWKAYPQTSSGFYSKYGSYITVHPMVKRSNCLGFAYAQFGPRVISSRDSLVVANNKNLPFGCSVQAKGDWAAHWNINPGGLNTNYVYRRVQPMVSKGECYLAAIAQFGQKVIKKRNFLVETCPIFNKNSASCSDIPYGCSIQSTGDFAAHWNANIYGNWNPNYKRVFPMVTRDNCLNAARAQYGDKVISSRNTLVEVQEAYLPFGCSVQAHGDWAAHWNLNVWGVGEDYKRVNPVNPAAGYLYRENKKVLKKARKTVKDAIKAASTPFEDILKAGTGSAF